MADRYDLVVIGAGTGGYVAAIRAAQLGLTVAVVERQPSLGGTCLNWGCIPTKALLEHAHALKIAQQAAEWGISFGPASAAPAIDMTRVHARKDGIVSGLTRGVEFLFKKHKVDWIKGTGRIVSPGRVQVSGDAPRLLVTTEIVVATGSRPRPLAALPTDGRTIITSDEAIHLAEVPRSLAVVGSGAVGLEFASIFNRFGSAVTIIELEGRLAPGEDIAVSAELERAFRNRRIAVRTGTEVTSGRTDGTQVTLEVRTSSGATETLQVEKVLVAAGRMPVTEGVGAEEVGLAMTRGYITVDALFRTVVPRISAIGDVVSIGGAPHMQLAHVSSAEGVILAERLAGQRPQPIDYDGVPVCTYTDPEVARVGLTEAEAVRRGFTVRTGTFPFTALGRARIAGETEGFVKVVGETAHDQLLGVHIVGPRATEVIAEAVTALKLEATVEELIRTIHAHPTMAEALGEAAHAAHGAAIHL